MYDTEKELWVIDKSSTGIRSLPRSYFHFNDGLPQNRMMGNIYKRHEYGKDKPMHGGLFKEYPCKSDNPIFNYFFKKNIEKMNS